MLYLDIHPETFERIANSPAVLALDGKPRYELWMHPDTPTSGWIEWLGVDFDNRQHLVNTAYYASGICDIEGTDAPTTRAVVMTALVHDAAESVVGDENFFLKNDGDDLIEIELIEDMAEDGRLQMSRDELEIVLGIMNDKHRATGTEAGQLFDLAEIIGYGHSGITAWRAAHDPNLPIPAPQRDILRLLAVHLSTKHYTTLRSYRDAGRRSPDQFFGAFAGEITAILNFASDERVTQALHKYQVAKGITEAVSLDILAHLEDSKQHFLGRTGLRVVA